MSGYLCLSLSEVSAASNMKSKVPIKPSLTFIVMRSLLGRALSLLPYSLFSCNSYMVGRVHICME